MPPLLHFIFVCIFKLLPHFIMSSVLADDIEIDEPLAEVSASSTDVRNTQKGISVSCLKFMDFHKINDNFALFVCR